jgi:hypothetical protein
VGRRRARGAGFAPSAYVIVDVRVSGPLRMPDTDATLMPPFFLSVHSTPFLIHSSPSTPFFFLPAIPSSVPTVSRPPSPSFLAQMRLSRVVVHLPPPTHSACTFCLPYDYSPLNIYRIRPRSLSAPSAFPLLRHFAGGSLAREHGEYDGGIRTGGMYGHHRDAPNIREVQK